MEASHIAVTEQVPASKKLQAKDAEALLQAAASLIVMKGKKVEEFNVSKTIGQAAITAMLGPTGNLRAPTIKIGKTFLVGFNEDIFAREMGVKRG